MCTGAIPLELMDLRQFVDKTVVLHMMDGETAKVRVDFLDQEYEDIIVKVLETSHLEHYRDSSAAYTFAAADIASAKLAE